MIKNNLQNRIHYLEEKLKDVNEKATLVDRKPESSITNNISQAISNLVSLHYSRYSEKRVGREIADVVWPHNFMNGVVRVELSKRARTELISVFFLLKY